MWSAYSVPRMTTLSKPLPPSIETGAFTLYMTWLLPAPVRMSDSAAVEKPEVRRGIAIWSSALIHLIWQLGEFTFVAHTPSVPVVTS